MMATVYSEPENSTIPEVNRVPAIIFFLGVIEETPTRPSAQAWIKWYSDPV